ncbi:hypothetical protein K493DRAFT_305455 [Basidiobolus meristosporus CBS 931.73]|uniref:Uncharacterized protein n=1 Tax=Basidiobolus meristosporus CBS 931.73 TaxID=1314790 RepID=A0A1Y1XWT5_9FUNG|nr:hypothetical protein K493DRAFT_305455 [Basidiobolus meristosporus CBS 931.73]|eukprot:ORX89804.1 hypothetical protein K493DRAFT_305455 [Basidiobolus meristosporus CBS 931.73]
MTPPADICSAQYCTIQSTCDGAWTLPDAPYNLQSGTCCGGVHIDQNCSMLSGEVNPCDDGSICHIENNSSRQQRGITVSGVCVSSNEKHSIWIGVILVLLGGTTLNIGLNLQKYALRKIQERKKLQLQNSMYGHSPSIGMEQTNGRRSLLQRLTYSNSKINPFAPQSLVAPLGAISLVTNVIIAPIMNKEKLGRYDIIGVVVIIAGCVLVVIFSGVVVQDYSSSHLDYRLCVLLNLFKQRATIVYIVLIFAFIVFAFFYIKIIEKNITPEAIDTPMTVQPEQVITSTENGISSIAPEIRESIERGHNSRASSETSPHERANNSSLKANNKTDQASSIVSNDGHDSTSEHPILSEMSEARRNSRVFNSVKKRPLARVYWERWLHFYHRISIIPSLPKTIPRTSWAVRNVLPLCYAFLGAMMATMTTLFAKSLINLLSVSILQKSNQFKSPLAWIILIVTVITAVSQVYWINMGLQRYDAMLQVPVFYVIWTVFDIIGGGIYYNEFMDFTAFQYGMFSLGVIVIFGGVALLSKRMSRITKKDLEFENELRNSSRVAEDHSN